jgi:hypothetical protein
LPGSVCALEAVEATVILMAGDHAGSLLRPALAVWCDLRTAGVGAAGQADAR